MANGNQMASGQAVIDAVDTLNYRWFNEGVAVRLLECSMTCMSKWKGGRFWQGAEMRRRGGVVRYQISDKDCVSPEMSRDLGPASLLRWDLPNAIFNGGRCVSPAPYERVDFPAVPAHFKSSVTPDGYMVNGFVGHNVTSAGVGWIFGGVPLRARGGAFGHDAWTPDYTRSGTFSTVHGPSTLSLCQPQHESGGNRSADYAEARLAARSQTFRNFAPGSAEHRAATYKWGFVNGTWNCYHDASAWERAFDDQRAYALLVAKRKEELPGECSIWGSLYNQIHFSWKASDLNAIFYVNDTLTAQRAPKANVAQLLLSTALVAAKRAYGNALIMQRIVHNRTGAVLPIVQFPLKHECFDGRPLERRLNAAALGPDSHGGLERRFREEGPFTTTPEAESEASTLLAIANAKRTRTREKAEAKKRKAKKAEAKRQKATA